MLKSVNIIKRDLTVPPFNPEADGVTLPSSDVIYAGKDNVCFDKFNILEY
jgi:hypothetical protein